MKIRDYYTYSWFANLAYVNWREETWKSEPILIIGRKAGLTPGMVTLAPAGLSGRNFLIGNTLSPRVP